MTFTTKESLEARRELIALFEEYKTQTVFVVQRHVSRSGMRRYLDLYILPDATIFPNHDRDSQIYPQRITYQVAQALKWVYNTQREALEVDGCGMDMHFHTVYTLSRVLYQGKHNKENAGYKLTPRTI